MAVTYDLATIIKGDDNIGIFSLTHPYRSGMFITGIQKLVQRFITELLTDVGSVRLNPSYGSNLLSLLGRANVQAVTDVHGALVSAIHQVRRNMQQRIVGDEPADEILHEVIIERLEPVLDRVIVVLKVVAASGAARVTNFPLEIINGESNGSTY
jgi:hypothetical protein